MARISIFDELKRFNADKRLRELHSRYETNSFLNVLSASRRELSHSSFLSELLKDDSFHGAGTLPLQLFLEAILYKAIEQDTKLSGTETKVFFSTLQSAIMSRSLSMSEIEVSTEVPFTNISNREKGRIDLLISCKVNRLERDKVNKSVERLNIIVENKVYSGEGDGQTTKYYEYFNALLKNNASKVVGKNLQGHRPRSLYNLYVYLTPNKDTNCNCSEFVKLSYQDILDHVLIPLLDSGALSKRGHFFVDEYRRSLGVSFENIEIVDDRKGTGKIFKSNTSILAISQDDAKLVYEFWQNYHDLLVAAINEKNTIADAEEDLAEVENTASGRKLYEYNGQSYCMGRLVESVILDLLSNKTVYEINKDFKEIFPRTSIVVEKKDITEKSRYYYEPVTMEDSRDICVYKVWSEENFQRFSRLVKEKFSIIIDEYKEEEFTKEESGILIDFYDKYAKLIRIMMEVINYSNDDEYSDLKEKVKGLAKRTNSHRTRVTYSVKGSLEQVKLSPGRLVLTILKDYVNNLNSNCPVENLNGMFGLENKKLKKCESDMNKGYSGYFVDIEDQLSLYEGGYVVPLQWNDKEINNFIRKAKEQGYFIEQENKTL